MTEKYDTGEGSSSDNILADYFFASTLKCSYICGNYLLYIKNLVV
jgi:hypothetical protein